MRQGNVRLVLNFGAALEQTVTVVAYAEFENVIEIDRNRKVVFDFGSLEYEHATDRAPDSPSRTGL